jgi:hypothetical protein
MTLCYHYSFAPYNEWALDYLVTTTLCPTEFHDHPRYLLMCIIFNAFGKVLHRFIWNGTKITFDKSPDAFHALTSLRHISCGWTLFQELLWARSPHTNGPFRDFLSNTVSCLPISGELIAIYVQRVQYISQKIYICQDKSGMQHELLHHFVYILSQNDASGLTRSVLLPHLLIIKQACRSPSHPAIPLPFTYHEVITIL